MAQAKENSTTQRRGSRTSFDKLRMRAALDLREFDDLPFDAVRAGGLGRLLTGVALVYIGQIDAVPGGGLHGLGQPPDLGAIVRIGGRDVQRQEVAQGVDGQMDLRPLFALGPIIAGPLAALGCRAQGPTVEEGRTRVGAEAGGQAQERAQIVGQLLEAARRQPALGLLVNGFPGREVMGHPPPRRARLHDVAQPVEHLAERMLTLPRILTQRRQVGGDQRPFIIGHVGWLGRARRGHAPSPGFPPSQVHNSL